MKLSGKLLSSATTWCCVILFFTILLTGSAMGVEPEKMPFEVISASVDPDYDGLLVPRKRGWLGADGATSIPLGKNKNLWLFGDTILGTLGPKGKEGATMVRNTIGLQDLRSPAPDNVEFYWSLSDNIVGSFFSAEEYDQKYWYWPMTGTLVDGELFLFLSKMLPGEGEGGLSFQNSDTILVRISNPLAPPYLWKKNYSSLGMGTNHQGFCSGILVEKPYCYLLGFDDHSMNNTSERRMVLARVRIHDLKKGMGHEAFEYWVQGDEGGCWSRTPENLLPLFSPGVTESSLQYIPQWDRYIAVTHNFFQPEIYIVSAPKLTGPWSQPQKVYAVPEMANNKNYHAYAMKSHPELARSPDELVITYVVNSTDFWSTFSDLSIYYPRFVRIKLQETQ